jgi:hypothetical protein
MKKRRSGEKREVRSVIKSKLLLFAPSSYCALAVGSLIPLRSEVARLRHTCLLKTTGVFVLK